MKPRQSGGESQHRSIKGLAWLLDSAHSTPSQPNTSRQFKGVSRVMQQNRKWKKNTANRFARYAKVMSRTIENKLKQEDRNFNNYNYCSLRKTESQAKLTPRHIKPSITFNQQRTQIQGNLFELRKKEKGIELEVEKVGKLKEITNIFQQKKQFYDSCIEGYFKNYEKEINKTISKLTKGPYLHKNRQIHNS